MIHFLDLRTQALRAPVLLLLVLLAACSSNEPAPRPSADPATRVTAPAGTFVGFVDPGGAHVWRGLRYAAAPVDQLRWRAPQPQAAVTGEQEAIDFGNVCPQIGSALGGAPDEVAGTLWGEEDCLFLNVYAPSGARTNAPSGAGTNAPSGAGPKAPAGARTNLPVMVWIHGGGNTAGHAGFYDATTMVARHDVIVVTLNYRLGPLGWLRHPALAGDDASDASGNYGTLDLIRALAWTQENIAAFGGDPGKVTVFGESAGASNIVSLLVSPLAAGLFRGAILQSGGTGSASAAFATHRRDHPEPGASSSSGELLLRALQRDAPACDRACAVARIDAMTLPEQEAVFRSLSTADVFDLFATNLGVLGPDSPAVIRDGTVLPDAPFLERLGTPGAFHPVPVLLGTNRDEPKIFMAFNPERVRRFAGLPIWARDARMYDLHGEYGGLAWKLRGVDEPAQRLQGAGVPVWAYRWDWDEEGSFLFVDLTHLVGAAHGLEIPFVFGHFDLGSQTPLLFNEDNASGRDALSERMMAYWVAFARDLDPATGADDRGPLWTPYDPSAASGFMRFDTGADGITMMSETLDFEGFVARLEADTRFRNAAERCAVFSESLRYERRPEAGAAATRLGCSL